MDWRSSSESQVRGYSGNTFFIALKTIAVSSTSRGTNLSNDGCWSLTATFWPFSRNVAMCTCASEATPMGLGSNSKKYSSNEIPMSCSNISFSSSRDDSGHSDCRGIIVLVHSGGSNKSLLKKSTLSNIGASLKSWSISMAHSACGNPPQDDVSSRDPPGVRPSNDPVHAVSGIDSDVGMNFEAILELNRKMSSSQKLSIS
ncbi:hypothetical protein OGATHE_000242 [Ogataea polymorpha]|uniref:Uncharacterized protein n=1 Tax=Ogataea polymorpha TaxID=460523 RepID=A0A9P8PUK9_9ASCO|nr:hypothetical protein OGATHE_000242 [Ogataea polymorpha]